jgi:hypothetical protein
MGHVGELELGVGCFGGDHTSKGISVDDTFVRNNW